MKVHIRDTGCERFFRKYSVQKFEKAQFGVFEIFFKFQIEENNKMSKKNISVNKEIYDLLNEKKGKLSYNKFLKLLLEKGEDEWIFMTKIGDKMEEISTLVKSYPGCKTKDLEVIEVCLIISRSIISNIIINKVDFKKLKDIVSRYIPQE